MADENGEPMLIDPAVYVGCSEADIAMTLDVFLNMNSSLFFMSQDIESKFIQESPSLHS